MQSFDSEPHLPEQPCFAFQALAQKMAAYAVEERDVPTQQFASFIADKEALYYGAELPAEEIAQKLDHIIQHAHLRCTAEFEDLPQATAKALAAIELQPMLEEACCLSVNVINELNFSIYFSSW